MSSSSSSFARLNAINVSANIEKKGGFSYLSWPYAVAQLRLAEPTASWEVRRFNGLPFLATDAGVFVEVAVTVQAVTLSQIHPVLDGRNRPLLAPTAFDINTSIQRCLVKCIALFGLGLYIYAGEDLPQPAADAANDPAAEPKTEPATAAPPTGPTISAMKQTHIHRLITETGTDIVRFCAYFGVKAVNDILDADFVRVIRSLESRRAAA